MGKGCHKCRYHLDGVNNPYHRCLIFYNQCTAVEQLKKGLIGKCEDYKSMLEYEKEEP